MLPTTERTREMKGQQMWWDIYPDREEKKNHFFYLKKKEVKRATLCDDKSSLHWKDASEWESYMNFKIKSKIKKSHENFKGNLKKFSKP